MLEAVQLTLWLLEPVPLALCFVASLLQKRDPAPEAWLLAIAIFLSFPFDGIAKDLAEQGINNHWTSYLFAPLQIAVMLMAVTENRKIQRVLTLAFAGAAGLSALRGPLTMPETVVQAVGGLVVAGLAWKAPSVQRYRRAIWSYCLWSAPGLVLMLVLEPGPWFVAAWASHQIARVVGMGFLAWAILGPAPTLEVVRVGRGGAETAGGERRAAGRVLSLPRRDRRAPPQGQRIARHG